MKNKLLPVLISALVPFTLIPFSACKEIPKNNSSESTANSSSDSSSSGSSSDDSSSSSCSGNDDILEKIDFSNINIGFLGDSITYGIDGSANQSRMEKPLPVLVRELLDCKNSFNYGISGSILSSYSLTNSPMVNRYTEMADNLDIICLFGGINDFALGVPLGDIDSTDKSTIYGALNTLCIGLKQKYPNSFIFMLSPLGLSQTRINNSPATYSVVDVGSAIKQVGEKRNVPVLDLYNTVNYRTTEMLEIANDGIHPSQNFHKENTAPAIADFIRKNYKE